MEWFVFVPGATAPKKKHKDYITAKEEARRLVMETDAKAAYVCEIKALVTRSCETVENKPQGENNDR